MIGLDWIALLRRLLPVLHRSTEPWVLTGSAAFAAQGWPVEVHDLDLQTTGPGARFLGESWRSHAVFPVAWRAQGTIRSWFGRFAWEEGTVDVIGDMEHQRTDGSWAAPPPLHVLRRWVPCPGLAREIPVLPLRYEAEAYRRMGRADRAAALVAWAQAQESPAPPRVGRADDGLALLQALAEASYARGLLPAGTVIDGATAFRLVRDLPYERPSDNRPETLIQEWRGTCSGKHRLLGQLLAALGYRTRLMIATYIYDPRPSAAGPMGLGPLWERGPVPDVHTFLEVACDVSETWAAVDATWPTGADFLGFPVNGAWRPGEPQPVACMSPFHAWEVPPDVDPDRYKADVVRIWCGKDRARREALIAAFSAALRARRPAARAAEEAVGSRPPLGGPPAADVPS